ncbi:hypothetical protein NMG60_11012101 [Bertholletia excelsa]
MEQRIWFLCGFLFLLCCSTDTDATGNVNLSPFEGYRSVHVRLLNLSRQVPIDRQGWINVTWNDTDNYSKEECADHTRAVLTCIHHMKHEYRFISKATVQDLNQTITLGC